MHLESDLDKVSSRDDLVLINSKDNTTPMYFAHRKGWATTNEHISNPAYLIDLKSRGLKIIVILKRAFGSDMTLDQPILFENEDYRIYSL